MTKAQKRGRERAEAANRERAAGLLRYLEADLGLALRPRHGQAIQDWMRAEFYRGIDYGKRLAK